MKQSQKRRESIEQRRSKKNKLVQLTDSAIPLPKHDPLADKKDRKAESDKLREENRKLCLRLDAGCCQNPFCDCVGSFEFEKRTVSSHHILGRTEDNRFDGVEYRITFSMKCHDKYDKDREGVLKILIELKRIANPNYRWDPAIEELEKII